MLYRKEKRFNLIDLSHRFSQNLNQQSLRQQEGMQGIKNVWWFSSKFHPIHNHLKSQQRKNSSDISISNRQFLFWKTWIRKVIHSSHKLKVRKNFRSLPPSVEGKTVPTIQNLYFTNPALQHLFKPTKNLRALSLGAEAVRNSQISKKYQQVVAMYNSWDNLNLVRRKSEKNIDFLT